MIYVVTYINDNCCASARFSSYGKAYQFFQGTIEMAFDVKAIGEVTWMDVELKKLYEDESYERVLRFRLD